MAAAQYIRIFLLKNLRTGHMVKVRYRKQKFIFIWSLQDSASSIIESVLIPMREVNIQMELEFQIYILVWLDV